jgi:hypothetical protein
MAFPRPKLAIPTVVALIWSPGTTPRILTPDYGANLAFAAPFAKKVHHTERLLASYHCASRHDAAAVSSSNRSTGPTSDSSYTVAGSSQGAYCAP